MSFADTLEQLREFDINNLDADKMGIWPWPIKLILCMIVVGLVFAGIYYFKISDLQTDLQSLASKEVRLKEEYKTKSFEAANLDAYRTQMAEMKKTFESLLSRLPLDTEVPGLLEDIDKHGSESGLTIVDIKLEEEKAAEYYVELPISIIVEGGYHDLGSFVSGVAGMPRIVTLHDYTINTKKDTAELTMRISAKTYRYKPQETK